MKFLFVVLATLLLCANTSAQTIDNAKSYLSSGKLTEAKKEIDAVLALEKFQKSADAYYQKGKIYSAISLDPVLSKLYPGARMDAFNAIKKYTEVDDKMLIALQIDGYKPINDIYTGFYQDGANYFNNKDYHKAFDGFVHAITVSTFMTQKSWIDLKLDTNSVLYAAISAEKINRLPDAARYYGMLIDARVKGEGFGEIYKWVADYYLEQKDRVSASRYVKIGKEAYPEDPFWVSIELDIARETGNKNELFALYEKAISANPNNHLYRYNYAVELYQHAYNVDPSKRPPGSEVLIAQVESQLKESLLVSPYYARAQLFLGQVIYNRGVDQLTLAKTSSSEEKKKELNALALQHFVTARPYFLIVERLLENASKKKPEDISNLKEAYDLLITIYDQENNKEKVKEYELKFNALK